MKTTVVRRMRFSAGHRLHKPELSDRENFELYGPCSNAAGHGHNYELEIHITGEVDKETGYVVDLKKLKEIIELNIISKLDHKNLNEDVEFMKGIVPTTENLAQKIFSILDAEIGGNKLTRVVLRETENNRVEVSR